MIRALHNSAANFGHAVASDLDVVRVDVARRLMDRLGLVTRDAELESDRDELALLSTRPWTLALGDAMLRRFL